VWLAQQTAYDLWQARAAVKASKALSGVKTAGFLRDVKVQALGPSHIPFKGIKISLRRFQGRVNGSL